MRAHAGGAVRSPFSALSDSDLLGGTALSETAPPPAGGDDVEAATRHYAQCGKCRSVYALSLDALGRSGTKVSCSVCGHSWWQTADRLQELREGWTYGDIPDGRLEQIKANVAAGKKPMETKPKVKGEVCEPGIRGPSRAERLSLFLIHCRGCRRGTSYFASSFLPNGNPFTPAWLLGDLVHRQRAFRLRRG